MLAIYLALAFCMLPILFLLWFGEKHATFEVQATCDVCGNIHPQSFLKIHNGKRVCHNCN